MGRLLFRRWRGIRRVTLWWVWGAGMGVGERSKDVVEQQSNL